MLPKTRQRLSLLPILGISAMLLGGCGTSKELPSDKIVLTYMAPKYGEDSFAEQEIVERINETYDNVEIHPVLYSEEQYYTILKTRLATGKGPDLFIVQPDYAGFNGVASLAESGYLKPVTDSSLVASLPEDSKAKLGYQEEVYALSGRYMALGLVYNETLFEENNLEFPTCWEEFLDCCETLKNLGIQPLTVGGKNKSSLQSGLYQIALHEINETDPDYNRKLRSGEAHFTDPGTWDSVIETYLSLYQKGYLLPEVLELTVEEAQNQVTNREAAMILASDITREGTEDVFRFVPLPANDADAETHWSMGETGGIAIYSGSEHVELLKQLLQDEFWPELLRTREQFEATQDPRIQEAYENDDYLSICNHEWPNEVEIVMEKKISEAILNSEITAADITAAMQEELER